MKTGRGSASLVQGEADGHDELDETRGKGKGKGIGGKGEHGGKGDKEGKGFQQSVKMTKGEEEQETAEEDEGRVRMAPNVEAGGSHHQATTDLEEKLQRKKGQWVLRPARKWWKVLSLVGKWADCVAEEPEEEAEEGDKHEAEDEREQKKAEEQGRSTERQKQ